jgi:hypothetical protein
MGTEALCALDVSALSARAKGKGKMRSSQVETVLQKRTLAVCQCNGEELQDCGRLGALSSTNETASHAPVVTCLSKDTVCHVSAIPSRRHRSSVSVFLTWQAIRARSA